MDNLIQETEKELQDLKQELIACANAIKICTIKEERQKLFDEKKEIQFDISEVETDLQKLVELRDNPVAEGSSGETTEELGEDVAEPVEQSENEEENN